MNKSQNRGPIKKKILIITLSGILFACTMISIVSYLIFNSFLHEELINNTRVNLLNLSEAIEGNVENVYRFARYCQGSADIAAYVKGDITPGASVSTYNRLYEQYQINESSIYIPRACIIADDRFMQVCATPYSTTTDISSAVPQLEYFDELLSANDFIYTPGIINDPFTNRTNKQVIPIIRPITYQFNSNQGGVLFMEISTDIFLSEMEHYHMDAGNTLYLIMADHIYRYEDEKLIDCGGDFDSSLVKSIRSGEYDFDRSNMVAIPLSMTDCFLLQDVSTSSIWNNQEQFILLFLLILVSVIAIGVIIHVSLEHYIMKPLIILRERIALTSSGDFSVDPSIEWDNELGEIGHGINELSESVMNLLDKRLEDEKQKQDLEYKMLQSQINPHFLYNTLNSIKMMATIQGAKGISDMTTALASLLRSISKGTSLLIPISEEIKLISDYFTIQNYRYGGMISLHINVSDKSIEDMSILKFTLQPLVENAIFHGIEPKGGTGSIDINMYFTDEKDVCIEVTDDGVGMDKESAQKILSDNSPGKAEFFKEIGISNVNKRLQYEFGQSYGISIESEPGSYTTMRVTLPSRHCQLT